MLAIAAVLLVAVGVGCNAFADHIRMQHKEHTPDVHPDNWDKVGDVMTAFGLLAFLWVTIATSTLQILDR